MSAVVQPSEAGYQISGNFILSFDSSSGLSATPVPLRFTQPFDLPLKFSANHTGGSQWRFDLTNADQHQTGMTGPAFEFDNTFYPAKESAVTSVRYIA
jgi:hypothetical protein